MNACGHGSYRELHLDSAHGVTFAHVACTRCLMAWTIVDAGRRPREERPPQSPLFLPSDRENTQRDDSQRGEVVP